MPLRLPHSDIVSMFVTATNAGIAGLACALALRRVGHHVLVLERQDRNSVVRDAAFLSVAASDIVRSAGKAESGYHQISRKFCSTGVSKTRSSRRPWCRIRFSSRNVSAARMTDFCLSDWHSRRVRGLPWLASMESRRAEGNERCIHGTHGASVFAFFPYNEPDQFNAATSMPNCMISCMMPPHEQALRFATTPRLSRLTRRSAK